MTPLDLSEEEATAYHEAGHAVMGCLLDRRPLRVDILPDSCGNVGHTKFPDDFHEYEERNSDDQKKIAYVETRVLIEVAGTIAHDFKCPTRNLDSGDKHDEYIARELIECIQVTNREELFKSLRRRAKELIFEHWAWVDGIARTLVEKKELDGSQLPELRPLAGSK